MISQMTGLFHHKYHVAVLDGNQSVASHIATSIKNWLQGKVVVESFSDSYQMFVGLNIAKAKNKPFDMTVVGPDEDTATKAVLEKTDPSMMVVAYKDDATLKKQTARLTLKHTYSHL